MTQQIFPDHMKSWIAENLAQGCSTQQIKTYLLNTAYPEDLVDQEILAASTSPYLPAVRAYSRLLKRRDSLLKTLDFYWNLNSDHKELIRKPLPFYADFIKDYLSQNRPGLFSGAFEHWPARGWTPKLLEEKIGPDTQVPVQSGRNSDPNYDENNPQHGAMMACRDFISLVENSVGNDVYLTAVNFALDKPEFGFVREDIGSIGDGYITPTPVPKSIFLWMGPAGVVTSMHQDLNHILFCQIYGRKTFRLYPAIQVPYMYNHRVVYSPVNPVQPDLERHPLFENANGIEITVEAGDMLYIPIGWWHHVVGETASISVSLTDLVDMPNHFVDYPYNVFSGVEPVES
ncbi:cupin-like domain-containing protein [Acetobacter farinalis]|uniref:Cupin-like domain-containing protein n=1 Tax=Acetobacter farinalis TaxID=1260984 RepID=A0ABT3Q8R2_9PROT|nr:cupin-like domain-containing protein [Acetobacter farinalis]MCX2561668.1 cupin-like domain-containing protein [Acetobacter farinalis]NHO30165.1 hypothetical protein [Acetobacter farinalis]